MEDAARASTFLLVPSFFNTPLLLLWALSMGPSSFLEIDQQKIQRRDSGYLRLSLFLYLANTITQKYKQINQIQPTPFAFQERMERNIVDHMVRAKDATR